MMTRLPPNLNKTIIVCENKKMANINANATKMQLIYFNAGSNDLNISWLITDLYNCDRNGKKLSFINK